MTKIYALSDPNTNKVMYVGKTKQRLSKRLYSHCRKSRRGKTDKEKWILSLKVNGQLPICTKIDDVDDSIWKEREIYWISYYKSINPELTNISNGGQGCTGGRRYEDIERRKTVYQYTKDHKFIKKWDSITYAGKSLNISKVGISASAAPTNRKKSAGGFIWSFDPELKTPVELSLSELFINEGENPLFKIKEAILFLGKTRSDFNSRIHTESKDDLNLSTLIKYLKELNIPILQINLKEGQISIELQLKDLGEIFKNRRKSLKLTTRSFPNTNSTTISRFENNIVSPFYYKLLEYCRVLNIKMLKIHL